MSLRILYIGGIYATEYSLFRECQTNSNLELVCMTGTSDSMESLRREVCPLPVTSRASIDAVKDSFKPDIVLFRGWCPETALIGEGEILWSQEIMATQENGQRFAGPKCTYEVNPDRKFFIAYNIRDLAVEYKSFWLPRCVSKSWAMRSLVKDIPYMVATNMPLAAMGGDLKRKSLDILVKPIVEWNASLVHAFSGCSGGLDSIPYMREVIKPSFPYSEMTSYIARAQIYASPTTIWYDKGCISHKTVHAMACGALTLTNRYADIEDVLGPDGENLIYSNSPEETLDKANFYFSNEKEREKVADRGYEFIHSKYNWEDHLTRLYKDIHDGQY